MNISAFARCQANSRSPQTQRRDVGKHPPAVLYVKARRHVTQNTRRSRNRISSASTRNGDKTVARRRSSQVVLEAPGLKGGLVHLVAMSMALLFSGLLNQQAAAPTLDYEYFKSKVQPIFVAKRTGHARCIACHGSGTPLRLQRPSIDGASWTEDESKKNFDAMRRVAFAGNAKSLLLIHALEEAAGGDFFHSGGKHWASQNDPEWQVLSAWIMGRTQ